MVGRVSKRRAIRTVSAVPFLLALTQKWSTLVLGCVYFYEKADSTHGQAFKTFTAFFANVSRGFFFIFFFQSNLGYIEVRPAIRATGCHDKRSISDFLVCKESAQQTGN